MSSGWFNCCPQQVSVLGVSGCLLRLRGSNTTWCLKVINALVNCSIYSSVTDPEGTFIAIGSLRKSYNMRQQCLLAAETWHGQCLLAAETWDSSIYWLLKHETAVFIGYWSMRPQQWLAVETWHGQCLLALETWHDQSWLAAKTWQASAHFLVQQDMASTCWLSSTHKNTTTYRRRLLTRQISVDVKFFDMYLQALANPIPGREGM